MVKHFLTKIISFALMATIFKTADFFAGSGLVSLGLEPHFQSVWANDIALSKERIYRLNHPDKPFIRKDLALVKGFEIPAVDLAWASFPCQDLSLAGTQGGIDALRSGLVWDWIRVLSEMESLPAVIVAENVYGLLTSNGGADFQRLCNALIDLGYTVGAVVVDASLFVPQSRVRVFIVGAQNGKELQESPSPSWCHPKALQLLRDKIPELRLWDLPLPNGERIRLRDIIDREQRVDVERSNRLLNLVPLAHRRQLEDAFSTRPGAVFAAYRRTRLDGQRLEVRFDEISGCLRTAKGGSSKQEIVFQVDGTILIRQMTAREAARAMGVPETFQLAGTINDAYSAMGDAVAVPVTQHLASRLLSPMIKYCYDQSTSLQFA
jgi:DNA (cytosine-5)-methyltransferase 1